MNPGAPRKVAIVTGASSGIGEATAARLSAAGYRVYGTSRRAAPSSARTFNLVNLDVTNDASVEEAVAGVLRAEGRIDVLVNNAGFGIAPAGAEESSIAQARAIFDTNFLGLVRMTRAVVPHMRSRGSGRILNIGSILGRVPMPYVALYVASKHAVEGYSEALDHELRTQGIRVSIIEPAFTKTQLDANSLEPDAKLAEYAELRAHLKRVFEKAMTNSDEPTVVAEVVLKAAEAANPRPRYTAGSAARRLSLLRRFAPDRMVSAGIRSNLRLDQVGLTGRKA